MVNSDFRDLIALLTRRDARFLIVGGYAVAAHGHARASIEGVGGIGRCL